MKQKITPKQTITEKNLDAVKSEFSLGLIKLKIVFLDLLAESILRMSLLKLFHSLKQYGLKDDSKVSILGEIDLYLLCLDDLVCKK